VYGIFSDIDRDSSFASGAIRSQREGVVWRDQWHSRAGQIRFLYGFVDKANVEGKVVLVVAKVEFDYGKHCLRHICEQRFEGDQ
jgi:hypothetical protein